MKLDSIEIPPYPRSEYQIGIWNLGNMEYL